MEDDRFAADVERLLLEVLPPGSEGSAPRLEEGLGVLRSRSAAARAALASAVAALFSGGDGGAQAAASEALRHASFDPRLAALAQEHADAAAADARARSAAERRRAGAALRAAVDGAGRALAGGDLASAAAALASAPPPPPRLLHAASDANDGDDAEALHSLVDERARVSATLVAALSSQLLRPFSEAVRGCVRTTHPPGAASSLWDALGGLDRDAAVSCAAAAASAAADALVDTFGAAAVRVVHEHSGAYVSWAAHSHGDSPHSPAPPRFPSLSSLPATLRFLADFCAPPRDAPLRCTFGVKLLECLGAKLSEQLRRADDETQLQQAAGGGGDDDAATAARAWAPRAAEAAAAEAAAADEGLCPPPPSGTASRPSGPLCAAVAVAASRHAGRLRAIRLQSSRDAALLWAASLRSGGERIAVGGRHFLHATSAPLPGAATWLPECAVSRAARDFADAVDASATGPCPSDACDALDVARCVVPHAAVTAMISLHGVALCYVADAIHVSSRAALSAAALSAAGDGDSGAKLLASAGLLRSDAASRLATLLVSVGCEVRDTLAGARWAQPHAAARSDARRCVEAAAHVAARFARAAGDVLPQPHATAAAAAALRHLCASLTASLFALRDVSVETGDVVGSAFDSAASAIEACPPLRRAAADTPAGRAAVATLRRARRMLDERMAVLVEQAEGGELAEDGVDARTAADFVVAVFTPSPAREEAVRRILAAGRPPRAAK